MESIQFKIHGLERRLLKKKLGELKRHVKNFWHYHQLDKDMASFYGGSDKYPMNDDKAKKIYDKTTMEIKELEEKLSIPYFTH